MSSLFLAQLFNLKRGVCTNHCRSAARGATAAAASRTTLEVSPNTGIVNFPAFAHGIAGAPTQSDQSSRVVDDAVKLAQAGVRIDPEELAEKTGYRLAGGASG